MTDSPNPYQSGTQQDTDPAPTVPSFPQASPFPGPQASPFPPPQASPFPAPPQASTVPPPQASPFPAPPQASTVPPPQASPFPAPPQGSPFPVPPASPFPADYGAGQYAGQPVLAGTLPDGVQLASAGRRIGAFFLAIPLSIITLGIGYVVWGLIAWRKGQTPALQVLGMRCWRPETQSVPGFWWMALREIVGRIAEEIVGPITLLASFILMMSSQDRKSLHDLIAGTVVVHDPNHVLSR
jgi:uncharacterized RDD family membrane protein YckC